VGLSAPDPAGGGCLPLHNQRIFARVTIIPAPQGGQTKSVGAIEALRGEVRDPAGAVVPGAKVTVTGEAPLVNTTTAVRWAG